MTQQDLIAAIGAMPASQRTPYQRVSYALSMLRTHADPTIAAAAKSLYDGSISLMSKRAATSTPEAIVAAVLARRK